MRITDGKYYATCFFPYESPGRSANNSHVVQAKVNAILNTHNSITTYFLKLDCTRLQTQLMTCGWW